MISSDICRRVKIGFFVLIRYCYNLRSESRCFSTRESQTTQKNYLSSMKLDVRLRKEDLALF